MEARARELSSPSMASASGLSGASGIMYVDEEVEEEASTVSGSLPAIEETTIEVEETYEVEELYASEPPAPMPRSPPFSSSSSSPTTTGSFRP